MGFFEAFRERTFAPYRESGEFTELELAGICGVMDAIIEALKEMMVGEPMEGTLKHFARHTPHDYGEKQTHVLTNRGSYPYNRLTACYGHHGTDGEEVYVMVLRRPNGQMERK